ncbi:MAG: hypothetical protein ACOX57_00935 [Limnochordia bacterium]
MDEAGLTAIFHAAKRNPDPEVIDVLVEAGADVDGCSWVGLSNSSILRCAV